MNDIRRVRALVTLALVIGFGLAAANGAAAQPQPQSSSQAVAAPAPITPADKKPAVEIGFEQRVRSETWNNIVDLDETRDDRRNQFRYRTRLWARVFFGDRVEVYAGLNSESRSTTTPSQPTVLDEIVVEHVYVDWKIDKRHSLRAGRQNMMRGDGFVFNDGTPLDGSRTGYFNALQLTRAFGPRSSIDLFAIDNPYRDRFLPRVHDQKKNLVEWGEQAFGAYLTDQRIPRTRIEGYVLRKTERNDYRGPDHRQFHPNRSIDIAGGRAVHSAAGGWLLTGEFAGEWGRLTESGTPIRAWGGHGYAKKAWPVAWKPTLQTGYIAMSGDDPSTATIEEWQPVFARWPRWSELYIYSLMQERGVAYWTNIAMYQAEVTAAPTASIGLRATFYKLQAFHPFPGPASLFGSGTDRGDLVQARLDITLNKHLRGHVLYETLWPGDFTRGRSKGYFFRTEVIYTFSRGFGHS